MQIYGKCRKCGGDYTLAHKCPDVSESELNDLLSQKLLMHSVSFVLHGCGNSYANAYVEKWLKNAKKLGAYHGETVGSIEDLKVEWDCWLDDHGGLPSLP